MQEEILHKRRLKILVLFDSELNLIVSAFIAN